MNATVAWSYQLLAPDEQRIFRRFGVLPGRFPIDAAAAVLAGREASPAASDEALRAAAGLIDKSLLLRTETSVVRVVRCTTCSKPCGRTRPSSSPRQVSATTPWRGSSAIASREASLAAEGLVGPAQVEWLDRVREDLESYRGALAWLIDHDRAAEAIDIALGLMFFWIIRGHAAEGLRWYEQILNLSSLPPVVESGALLGSGAMAYSLGDIEHARTALARALALAHDTGDMAIAALADYLLGRVEHALGHVDAAREHCAQSLEQFRALALAWGIGNSLTGMAAAHLATGDLDGCRAPAR